MTWSTLLWRVHEHFAQPQSWRTEYRLSLTLHIQHILSNHPSEFDIQGTVYLDIYIYIYISVSKLFPRCPTPRFHWFLSSHWPSFRFLSFMAFLIPSIQFFFGLPRALFCFGIHCNAILGNLSSVILWTWPYHVRWLSWYILVIKTNEMHYFSNLLWSRILHV